MNIKDELYNYSEEIIAWRRDLHQIPELGLDLPKTEEYVKNELDKMGLEYQTFDGHSGIVVNIGNSDGKIIAIRADMDGLPIKEDVDLDYKSSNDNMHACGHDAHTAILLGTAKYLKDNESKLKGGVKLLFQPGEEGPGGAEPMVKDGVLKNPDVDTILALHVENSDEIELGGVSVGYSAMYAFDDQIKIKIKGNGGHGSLPHLSVDPLAISSILINSLQQIVSREIDPRDAAVITIASIEGGRGTTNIISDDLEMLGTVRTLKEETREFVLRRIEEVTKYITKAFRADYELTIFDSYPGLINSREQTEKFIESAKKIVGEDISIIDKPELGGEDAAFFFREVPGTYFLLNTKEAYRDGQLYPPHNSKFMVDDSVLYLGSALFVQRVFDYFDEE